MIEDLRRILSEHPFVHGLEESHLVFLTGCTKNVKFLPGELLFKEGGPAKEVYLIRDGEAAIQVYGPDQSVTTLSTIKGGEIAGWSWVVPPYVSHFDLIAYTVVRAIAIDADCLRVKCENDPVFGYQMLARMVKVMEQRLISTRMQMVELSAASR